MKPTALAIILAAPLLGSGCGHLANEPAGDRLVQVQDENDVQVPIAAVPPSVRDAIEARLNGGRLNEIERSTENGVTRYEVDITPAAGGATEFVLASDGTLISDGDDDGDDDDHD